MSVKTQRRWSPAIIFLAVIAVIVIAVLIFFAWVNADPARTLRLAFVPNSDFASEMPANPLDYKDPAAWFQYPGAPSGETPAPKAGADVFFVHPTTYLDRSRWTDPLDDEATLARTDRLILQGQALVFGAAGRVYVPRYRQATFGAFLDTSGNGIPAINLAYGDVLRAFDAFMAARPADRPFILAGHSQGSLHLLRLLNDRIAAQGLQKQMVAAYLIGWPISVEADLGAVDGIDACAGPTDTACVLSWQSFGPDGDPKHILAAFNAIPGLNGGSRAGTTMLCVNPLTMTRASAAGADAHQDARPIDPTKLREAGELTGLFGAACGDDGILYLDTKPGEGWGEYVLAGENYHPYDLHFFFTNTAANAAARIAAWYAARASAP